MNKSACSKWSGFVGLCVGLLFSAGACGADIRVDGAWIFAPQPGKDWANVYMYVTSDQAVSLVDASSSKAKAVELRTMLHKAGMMKTIKVPSVEIHANTREDMTSEHGYHLTLVGLKTQLKAGSKVPLKLKFEQADKKVVEVDVSAEIRSPR